MITEYTEYLCDICKKKVNIEKEQEFRLGYDDDEITDFLFCSKECADNFRCGIQIGRMKWTKFNMKYFEREK